MNTFGIPAAIATAMMIYERASRNSGRTVSLLKAMDDGDVLLVGSSPGGDQLVDWCRRKLRAMGKEGCVIRVVSDMDDLRGGHAYEAVRKAMSRGFPDDFRPKLWMDHTLIFQLHEQAMAGVHRDLGGFLRSISQPDLKATLLGQMMRPGEVPPVAHFIRGRDFIL